MNKVKHFKKKNISLALQYYNLQNEYPDMKIILHNNKIKCQFSVTPTPLSKTYNIFMYYNGNSKPRVFLYGDNVLKIDCPDFPHIYDKNIDKCRAELCLYYGKEWTREKLISETIIPWIIEWLVHYEIWLVTGKWNGGGRHLEIKNEESKNV